LVTVAVGLLSFIVGAIATGAVQIGLKRHERTVEGRAAARVLFNDLWLGLQTIEAGIEMDAWWPADAKIDIPDRDWPAYRDKLAASLRADEWYTVAGAFSRMSELRLWTGDEDPAESKRSFDAFKASGELERTRGSLRDALEIVYVAGLTRSERRKATPITAQIAEAAALSGLSSS
jgi:hypothetical protein